MSDLFPDEIDEPLWEEACRRADAIRGFLRRHTHRTAAGAVAELAAELGLSQATAYRLIKLFRSGGTVLSLVDRKRGRPEGASHPGWGTGRHHPGDDQGALPEPEPPDSFAAGSGRAHKLQSRQVSNHPIAARFWPASGISTSRSAPSGAENRRSLRQRRRFQGHLRSLAPWTWFRSTIPRPISLSSTRKPGSRSADRG